jgi:hypothetical protein
MYNDWDSEPTVTNCTFTGNSARRYGGGTGNYQSSPTVTNCTFSGNLAVEWGGGMYNKYGSSANSGMGSRARAPLAILKF